MPDKHKEAIQEMGFEQAFAALQANVEALENEELPLEEALTTFERGQQLAKHCAALLESAELRVRQLTAASDDTLEKEG
jgi:exodeoxyribonuclease VII small subunit